MKMPEDTRMIVTIPQCPTCGARDRDNRRTRGYRFDPDGRLRTRGIIPCSHPWHDDQG